MVAPLYNLGLVAIVVFLFIVLFRTPQTHKRVYIKPWKYLFASVLLFIVEEVFTVLRATDVFYTPPYLNGFYELAIITLFIYALLLQKAHLKKHYS